ncbi:transposase [Streptomyces sp. NPDC056529]|uniref:transposase n=1 Tax=Streptomyces sp. NPDC056529 TaxID=3345855 RepID=UPI00367E6525
MSTDARRARIEPLLPDRTPRRGGRWRDHRQVIDTAARKHRTGSPRMDLPAEFGSWKGAYASCGLCSRRDLGVGVHRPAARADADEDLNRVVSVDSAVVHTRPSDSMPAPTAAECPQHNRGGKRPGSRSRRRTAPPR